MYVEFELQSESHELAENSLYMSPLVVGMRGLV